MIERRYSRQDALGRILFIDLYNGALRINDPQKRQIGTTFLLLGGRCKMRKSEMIHFHEGWLRRRYGLIEVPRWEPCMCKYCWDRAKRNHTSKDPYDSPQERFVNERYRSKNKRQRYVPYSWSARIIAAVEGYVDNIGVYPKTERQAGRLLQDHILENTEILEPGDIDWRGVRATGDTWWAFQGIELKIRSEIGGHREAELGTYSGKSPVEIANTLRESVNLEPLDFPSYDPITGTAQPHPWEPFEDPREVDPLENYHVSYTPPTFNPRTQQAPADVEVEKDDFDIIKSESETPSVSELKGLLERWESRIEGDPNTDPIDPYAESLTQHEGDDESKKPGQSLLEEWL